MAIQLIAGLGNPGSRYSETRHNAGAWLVEQLASDNHEQLRTESKFHANVCRINIDGHACWLMTPTTYMNESGQAIAAMAKFYKIPPEAILVAHDEIDFAPGAIKFKQTGGHGGHNGLRDIINHLHSKDFHRLRIGVGHPGNAKEVHDYVLKAPSRSHRKIIDESIEQGLGVLSEYICGDQQKAIRLLHNQAQTQE